MLQKRSDEEIIYAILIGNHAAFAELIRRHKNYVFTLCLRFAKNREDAEEIAQDTFVKVHKYLKDFKQESKFTTWLYRITYTTALTFLRKKKLDIQSLDDDQFSTNLDTKWQDISEHQIEKNSTKVYLEKAIKQLSVDDATVLNLFYLGEQSLEEIGKIMQIESKTVKVKLFRARQRLKEKLTGLLKHEVNDLL